MKTLMHFYTAFVLADLASASVWAQASPASLPSSPTVTTSISLGAANTATSTQTAAKPTEQVQLPPIALPRLSSIRIRIDEKTLDNDVAYAAVVKARTARDEALEQLSATNLRNDVSGSELKQVAKAVNAVNAVCAFGTDYIQLRMQKNSKWQLGLGLLSGLFGAATAAAPVIASAKVAGVAGLLTSNYKTEIVENGDTGRSNVELRKVLEDVRFELASGIQNYNRANLMPTPDDAAKLAKFRHLQAAVFEMHAACAYF